MPASASAVYPATSAWDPGPRPPVVVGSRPGRVSRPSLTSSLHGSSLPTRFLELSCASSVVAPLPAAVGADPELKVRTVKAKFHERSFLVTFSQQALQKSLTR